MHAGKNKHLKQLFHIDRGNGEQAQQLLSLRLGEKHGCFAVTNETGTVLSELAYCSVARWDETELAAFVSKYPVLRTTRNCQLVYDFPQSMLLPSTINSNEDQTLFLKASGHAEQLAGSGNIDGWQIRAAYAAPAAIQTWVAQQFAGAKPRQQFALGLRVLDTTANEGILLVDFREEDFTVLVARSGKLLLAQCFSYSTPNDVLYYLLKVTQQFGLSQEEAQLSLSGLVDQQSSLYRELYQYFIHINFRNAGWEAGNDYPAHFFTSLNDLATCAS